MGILEREITLIGDRGRKQVRALFDSGASYSIVQREVAAAVATLIALPAGDEWEFETAEADHFVYPTHMIAAQFHFEDSELRFLDDFIVFDSSPEPVIIGVKTMQAWNIRLDFENDQVEYPKQARRLRI